MSIAHVKTVCWERDEVGRRVCTFGMFMMMLMLKMMMMVVVMMMVKMLMKMMMVVGEGRRREKGVTVPFVICS